MLVDDPLQLLDKQSVHELSRFLGIEKPTEVRLLAPANRHAEYGLRFTEGGPLKLRLDRLSAPHGTAVDHIVAATLALRATVLPSTGPFRRIPDAIFDRPGLVTHLRPTSSGLRLCALKESSWTEVSKDLAGVLQAMSSLPQLPFGMRAVAGRFVPSRGCWADEWMHHTHILVESARHQGLDLGPLSTRAQRMIHDRRWALEQVQHHTLIHGELKPDALHYELREGGPVLVAIEGWDQALIGDPLVELGFLLTYPHDLLAPIIAAIPPQITQAWLEPDALARIEAYHLATILVRPSRLAGQSEAWGDGDHLRHLEIAAFHLKEALEPGFVRRRILAAMRTQPPFPHPYSTPTAPPTKTLVRHLVCLARNGGLMPVEAMRYLVAMGSALLAHQLDADELRAAACANVAERLLPMIQHSTLPEWDEPISDETCWIRALVSEMFVAEEGGAHGALVIPWLLAEALALLGPTVSGSVLRGIERTARTLAAADRIPLSPKVSARFALLTLAAYHRLEALGHPMPSTSHAELVLAQLEQKHPPQKVDDTHILSLLVDPEATDEQRALRPLLIYALQCVRPPQDHVSTLQWLETLP